MIAKHTLAAIDSHIEANQESSHRGHLGASIIGGKCSRNIFYKWRWAMTERHKASMLRLFNRGHYEEPRFVKYLESIGCTVWQVDPSTGKQWRIIFANGHGGGSTDGILTGVPDLPPGTNAICEFKTHNDSSFNSLKKNGLCQSKPEHFDQMMLYMGGFGLQYALYLAVNKNKDDLYGEIIRFNSNYYQNLLAKADSIVNAIPPKAARSAGASICKNYGYGKPCLFYDLCWNHKAPEKNCRTCHFSKPVEGGKWQCGKYNNYELSEEQQAAGCQSYRLKEGFTD